MHMFMIRPILLFCLLFSISFTSFSQRSLIRVSWEKDSKGDYVFYAENRSIRKQTVVVYFSSLTGLNPDTSLPAIKSVSGGKSRLFRLSKSGTGASNFNYGYSYYTGVANPKIKDFTYGLPIASGKETKTLELTSLKESYGDGEAPTDYYALGFLLNKGDTIFAARGGRVVEIEQDKEAIGSNMTYARARNKIEIEHKDGTIAMYSVFKKGSAMVEVGEDIMLGQPLALAEGEGYNAGYHTRLMVLYLKLDKMKNLKDEDFMSWGYVTPKFNTSDSDPKVLMNNIKYTSYIDEDMITQDMTKRQKKKYLKEKSSHQFR